MEEKIVESKLVYLCAGAQETKSPDVQRINYMISAGWHCKSAKMIEQTLAMIRKDSDPSRYIMMDTIGFTALGAELNGCEVTYDPDIPLILNKDRLNIPPTHGFKMAKNLGVNGVIGLDFPIRKLRNKGEQDTEFLKKLDINVKLALESARLRKVISPDIELFIPVQAYDLNQFDLFYSHIKSAEFDGFSMPVRNMDMGTAHSFLVKMSELGKRKVHILGTSSLKVIALGAFMTANYFDWVSMDSSTWLSTANMGRYINPYDLQVHNLNIPNKYDLNARCFCSACDGRSIGEVQALEKKERSKLLLTHNFLSIDGLVNEFQNAEFTAKYFKLRLSKSKRNDISVIIRNLRYFEKQYASLYHRAA